MKDRVVSVLGRSFLGPILSESDLRAAVQAATFHRFPAGSCLWHGGDPASAYCLVASGILKTSLSTSDGKEHIVELFTEGDVCGCVNRLLGGDAVFDLSAVTDAEVVCIPAAVVRRFERAVPRWFEAIARRLAGRLERENRLRILCCETASRKIPNLLLWLHDATGNSIPLTQGALGRLAGVSEETVCRALAPLKRRGLVSVSRGEVRVVCSDALRKFIAASHRA